MRITKTVAEEPDVSMVITAQPTTGGTYDLVVRIGEDEDITYPLPMVIYATVQHDTAIAGLVVSADVLDSSGRKIDTIDLLDDGRDADAIKDDGTYTGVFAYSDDGSFTIRVNADNSAGTGKSTTLGELASLLPDGSAQDQMAAQSPIGTSFTRSSDTSINVSGFRPDDHGDTLPFCTLINDDNSDVPGRIDQAGDVDCFRFDPSGVASDLMVRSTAQISGMDSEVTVLASDGTTVIKSAVASTSENPQSGVVLRIPATDIDASGMMITVKHRDTAAERGSYTVSVGTAIVSDTPPRPMMPAKSTGARATGGDAQVMLAWTNPSNATITKWQYRQKAGTGDYGSWADVPGSAASTTSHTVTGLTNGTRYTFQVRAVNAGGAGPASDEVAATPAATPVAPMMPAKPTGARATGGDAQVMLAWTNPSNATITKWQYRQKAGTGDYGSWADVPGSAASTTSHTVTGLTNGTRYTFQVRAVNAGGAGPASDEVAATPAATPVAPVSPPKKSGGSAIGSWTLGLAALLGIAGLFGRRLRS